MNLTKFIVLEIVLLNHQLMVVDIKKQLRKLTMLFFGKNQLLLVLTDLIS